MCLALKISLGGNLGRGDWQLLIIFDYFVDYQWADHYHADTGESEQEDEHNGQHITVCQVDLTGLDWRELLGVGYSGIAAEVCAGFPRGGDSGESWGAGFGYCSGGWTVGVVSAMIEDKGAGVWLRDACEGEDCIVATICQWNLVIWTWGLCEGKLGKGCQDDQKDRMYFHCQNTMIKKIISCQCSGYWR